MKPKVSVLMGVANCADTLGESIESILGQTFSDFELIIVENCSVDRTWEVVSSFKDSRIRALRTNFKGLPFNLNYGLIHAQADLIARMDGDDIAYPHRLAVQYDTFSAHPDLTVLGSWFDIFGPDVKPRTVSLPTEDKDIHRSLPIFFTICHPTVMFRRAPIMAIGGYGLITYAEDLDLWIRLLRNPKVRFANIPEPLLKYRVHLGQSKGKKESYLSAASVLFREGLYHLDWRCLVGSSLTVAKYVTQRVLGKANPTIKSLLRGQNGF